MSYQIFQFKQFSITQNLNAQKVGSDSMLLGAWTHGDFKRILDVGTGTGILALMMAQKNTDAKIIAIEPQNTFYEEANLNFQSSKFKNQIEAVCVGFEAYQTTIKFDLIICNPPYFIDDLKSNNQQRNQARHAKFNFNDFYKKMTSLLNSNGHLSLIFPYELEDYHLKIARNNLLFAQKILRTKANSNKFKRSLVQFSTIKTLPEINEMYIKNGEGRYSHEYIELTKDFYFKDLSQ